MKLRALLPLVVLAGLVGVFWAGLQRDPTIVPSPFIGKPAPAFDLPSLADPGRRVRSGDFAGRVWLLNVWGSWCPGCLDEHQTLLDYARRARAPLIGLDWKDSAEEARRWLVERGDPYLAVAVDADGRAAIDWGVYGAPETFVIDARGVVRYKHVGPLTAQDLDTIILPLVLALEAEAPR